MSNPFKIADVVVCTSPVGPLTLGKLYKVANVSHIQSTIFITELGTWFSATRFRAAIMSQDYPAPEAAPVAPKAKQPKSEADPNGKSPNEPGAKLDAGKLRPGLVLGGFANALEAVTKIGTDGAIKYTDNGWQQVPNGFARYDDAARRHTLKRDKGETHDGDSGSLHLAHEAWNALARLELYIKGTRK